jgi:hypothetical protein
MAQEIIKHTPFVWQILNVADEETIDYIRESCVEHLHNDTIILERDRNNTVKNSSYNLTGSLRLHPNIGKRNLLYQVDQRVNKIYSECQNIYCKENVLFQYSLFAAKIVGFRTEYHFRNYEVGEEYKWHIDLQSDQKYLMSGILYLNDDFDGGGTRFMMDKLTVEPKKGSMLMFPCGPYFVHKSVSVKEGTKNIIWSCYDGFSKKNKR